MSPRPMAKILHLPVAAAAADAISDEALLAACATGDPGALGALFDRHVEAMARFVRRLGHVRDQDVDDVVHDAFLEVLRSASSFRGGSSVRTWLLGVASNVARGRARAAVRLRALHDRAGDDGGAQVEAVDAAAARRQLLGRLEDALGSLPHDARVAFVLCDLEELPGVEVARSLGVPVGTLYRRLHDARLLLRQALDAKGEP